MNGPALHGIRSAFARANVRLRATPADCLPIEMKPEHAREWLVTSPASLGDTERRLVRRPRAIGAGARRPGADRLCQTFERTHGCEEARMR